jgi:hypothetical protein
MKGEFICKYFKVDSPEKVVQEHIEGMIVSQIQEELQLEFKAAAAYKQKRILQAISAFSNGPGGLLILGVKTEPDDENQPGKKIVNLDPLDPNISKDSLQQSLWSKVKPWPFGIYIQDVIIDTESQKGRIFLIDMPADPYPPHQVDGDGSYHIRLNGINQPMPFYMVEKAYSKEKKPLLVPEFEIFGCSHLEDKLEIRLRVIIANKGEIAATTPIVQIERLEPLGPEMEFESIDGKYENNTNTLHRDTGCPSIQRIIETPIYLGIPILTGEIRISFIPTGHLKITIGCIETPVRKYRIDLERIIVEDYIARNGESSNTLQHIDSKSIEQESDT